MLLTRGGTGLLDLTELNDTRRDQALDRLELILDQYESPIDDVQNEALAQAVVFCTNEWGSYRAGIEQLARRKETAPVDDMLAGEMAALCLREEAEEPGTLIRLARLRRRKVSRADAERAAIIARYGSPEAAINPSPVESMFVDAAAHLADPDLGAVMGEGASAAAGNDPWAPLAGWSVPWHGLPTALAEAVGAACPLPTTVADARAEALSWEERVREREVLADGPGKAALPTACAARHRLVEDAWRRDLPVRDAAEFEARLDYWATHGGDDGTGYAVLRQDWRRLGGFQGAVTAGESTKEKARQLREQHPGWSLARIGQELGISRQAVHKHLRG